MYGKKAMKSYSGSEVRMPLRVTVYNSYGERELLLAESLKVPSLHFGRLVPAKWTGRVADTIHYRG